MALGILATAYIFRFSIRSTFFQRRRAQFVKGVRMNANLPPDSISIPNTAYIAYMYRKSIETIFPLKLRRALAPGWTRTIPGSILIFFAIFFLLGVPLILLRTTRRKLRKELVALVCMVLVSALLVLAVPIWMVSNLMKNYKFRLKSKRRAVKRQRIVPKANSKNILVSSIKTLFVGLLFLVIAPSLVWTLGRHLPRGLKISFTLILCIAPALWVSFKVWMLLALVFKLEISNLATIITAVTGSKAAAPQEPNLENDASTPGAIRGSFELGEYGQGSGHAEPAGDESPRRRETGDLEAARPNMIHGAR